MSRAFIPREKEVLPRILLLDFSDEIAQSLADKGYSVFQGSTGLGASPFKLPKHESEIEIIFWDTSTLRDDQNILTVGSGLLAIGTAHGARVFEDIKKVLTRYFARIGNKGGFNGIFLNERQNNMANMILSDVLGVDFRFVVRRTDTLDLEPHSDEDVWYEFFKRFVLEGDITYSIDWNSNYMGLKRYFTDEDDKWYALYFHHIALIPKIADEKKEDALTFLLQDVLPSICDGDDIFPDKYYYRWTNKTEYLPPRVQELKNENARIATESALSIEKNNEDIAAEMEAADYLTNILVADDSNLFPDEKKLGASLHKVLEDDLGFSVTDVDDMQLEVQESLKEDKWIEDTDGYFALVEIKGTEKGAKANWIRKDLNAHIQEFQVLKGVTNLNSVLIFNHERRDDPAERGDAFTGDTALLEYCKKSRINLVPVYELFKMVRDVKRGTLSPEDARKMLKENVGLFTY